MLNAFVQVLEASSGWPWSWQPQDLTNEDNEMAWLPQTHEQETFLFFQSLLPRGWLSRIVLVILFSCVVSSLRTLKPKFMICSKTSDLTQCVMDNALASKWFFVSGVVISA